MCVCLEVRVCVPLLFASARTHAGGCSPLGAGLARPCTPCPQRHPAPQNLRAAARMQVVPSNFQIRGMQTIIRDRNTSAADFIFYSDRLLRLVIEASLGHLPFM